VLARAGANTAANKAIVAALLAGGVQAVGLSGVDGGLLRCVKKQHPTVDLGYVGQIVETQHQSIGVDRPEDIETVAKIILENEKSAGLAADNNVNALLD